MDDRLRKLERGSLAGDPEATEALFEGEIQEDMVEDEESASVEEPTTPEDQVEA